MYIQDRTNLSPRSRIVSNDIKDDLEDPHSSMPRLRSASTALEAITSRLANLSGDAKAAARKRQQTTSDAMLFKVKQKILMNNPFLFRTFKERLVASKVYAPILVHGALVEFFSDLKIPDIQHELKQEAFARSSLPIDNDLRDHFTSSFSSLETASKRLRKETKIVIDDDAIIADEETKMVSEDDAIIADEETKMVTNDDAIIADEETETVIDDDAIIADEETETVIDDGAIANEETKLCNTRRLIQEEERDDANAVATKSTTTTITTDTSKLSIIKEDMRFSPTGQHNISSPLGPLSKTIIEASSSSDEEASVSDSSSDEEDNVTTTKSTTTTITTDTSKLSIIKEDMRFSPTSQHNISSPLGPFTKTIIEASSSSDEEASVSDSSCDEEESVSDSSCDEEESDSDSSSDEESIVSASTYASGSSYNSLVEDSKEASVSNSSSDEEESDSDSSSDEESIVSASTYASGSSCNTLIEDSKEAIVSDSSSDEEGSDSDSGSDEEDSESDSSYDEESIVSAFTYASGSSYASFISESGESQESERLEV
jgi:hypothetical protein